VPIGSVPKGRDTLVVVVDVVVGLPFTVEPDATPDTVNVSDVSTLADTVTWSTIATRTWPESGIVPSISIVYDDVADGFTICVSPAEPAVAFVPISILKMVFDAWPTLLGDVNVIIWLEVLTPHTPDPFVLDTVCSVPEAVMSKSSTPNAGSVNCGANVISMVCPANIPFGDVNVTVWFEARLGAELDNVSLALVIDAASAMRKSVGRPVLHRKSATPTVIATACRLPTVFAVWIIGFTLYLQVHWL
jgi:hypothetical protein